MSSGLVNTSRNYTDSEHLFVGVQPRSVGALPVQNNNYSKMVGAGISSLSSDELQRYSELKSIETSGGQLDEEQQKEYAALKKKAGCWSGLGIRGPDFSLIQSQLSIGSGGYCAFLSTFICTMIVALLTGWAVANMHQDGHDDLNNLIGPSIWGIASLLACLLGTFCLCPPEINIYVHLCKLFFDSERFNKNLGMHLGHILGNAGWFVGYVIVWVVFEDYPGSYEAATAYVHAPYNIGRALLTEGLLTFVICLGALALSIVVPHWMAEKHDIKNAGASRLICCLIDALIFTGCTFAAWNVTGSAFNFFRWLAAAVMNNSFNYQVASSWWIYCVAGLAGCVVASIVFWAFTQLTSKQDRSKTQ